MDPYLILPIWLILGNWGIDERLEASEWAVATSLRDEATTKPIPNPGRLESPLSAAPPLLAAQLTEGGLVGTAIPVEIETILAYHRLVLLPGHIPWEKVCLAGLKRIQSRCDPKMTTRHKRVGNPKLLEPDKTRNLPPDFPLMTAKKGLEHAHPETPFPAKSQGFPCTGRESVWPPSSWCRRKLWCCRYMDGQSPMGWLCDPGNYRVTMEAWIHTPPTQVFFNCIRV